ncbi:MAG: hypothetical protein IPK50_07805 [Fibrobacterota bacterium]|nr:MAG: hypothetical protein IPK50_07805 [Fibrobacterota bacterium]
MGFADHNSSPGPEIFSSPMEYILFEYKGDCIINVNMGGANLYFMSFVLTEDEKEQSKGKKFFADWLSNDIRVHPKKLSDRVSHLM